MSGGVDSSVAAALLIEEGHEVFGLTLDLCAVRTEGGASGGCASDSVAAAGLAAQHLGIAHQVIDGRQAFEQNVLHPAWQEYAAGRTPNPCVLCNVSIKFGLLLEQARALGAQRLATGHYARLGRHPESGRPVLLRGQDRVKDQSYFLFALEAHQLEHIVFPLGAYEKATVRQLGKQFALSNAERPESQDACFSSNDACFAETLRARFNGLAHPGHFVDPHGKILGHHAGIHYFTIGQRKGLGLALAQPGYVLSIDLVQAAVVVTQDPKDLEASGLIASGVTWAHGETDHPDQGEVQVRYRHAPVSAAFAPGPGDTTLVRFATPQRAVTPGQAAVFYQGEQVLGGGWILESLHD
jgi:tRNA-uridine 2-sulfurtransferase